MSMRSIAFLLAASVVTVSSGVAVLEPALVRGLTSKSIAERSEASGRLLKERADVIRELSDLVRNPPAEPADIPDSYKAKRMAIRLLGRIRAAEAVDVLFENLKFKVEVDGGSYSDISSPSRNYPAVGSLVEIGTPALRNAWHRLENSDDELERELCIWIVGQVQGSETVRLLLERKQKQSDPRKQQRCASAREILGKYNFSNP